jgi:hypothetical protein
LKSEKSENSLEAISRLFLFLGDDCERSTAAHGRLTETLKTT